MESKIHGLDSDIFCCCREIETLNGPNDYQAKDLLTRAANQVKSIMVKRKWRVLKLVEFYPDNANLLGLNVNAGEKILIRLRRPRDFNSFLSYNSILGTLLHELCHNVHGPHNQSFYNLFNEITQECELSAYSSSSRSTISTPPQKLSQTTVKPINAHKAAAEAALKRAQYNNLIPQKSYRLGGGEDGIFKIALPTEMALAAAERRLLDAQWCGTDKPDSAPDEIQRSSAVTTTQKPIHQNAPKDWYCSRCTFLNKDLKNHCEICGLTQIKEETMLEWICSACTLINGPNRKNCTLCGNELKTVLVIN